MQSQKMIAYSCGAVADFHRASRTSHQRNALHVLTRGQKSSAACHTVMHLKYSHRAESLKRACVCPKNRNTNATIGHTSFALVRSKSRIVTDASLRESIQIDVNLVGLLARASLDRSNLPSASMHQWLLRLAPLRLQWLGRSGVQPDSHTTPSHKFYTG
jgi:hypothetical protein